MDGDFLLIYKIKNGDEKAMDQFVKQYYARILQYCRCHCADREQAQDLTQDTFVRFFRSLAGYQHIGKAANYLYVIARNVCIDFSKSGMEIPVEQIPEQIENPMDTVEARMDIDHALTMLPEELREVVILHYFQDLSLRESAEILSIGLPLVKYRIRKARELLRDLLGKEAEL